MTTSGATPYAADMHIFEGLVDLDTATLVARPALAAGMPEKINATTYRATPGQLFGGQRHRVTIASSSSSSSPSPAPWRSNPN